MSRTGRKFQEKKMHSGELDKLDRKREAKRELERRRMRRCDMCGAKTRVSRKHCSGCQDILRRTEELYKALAQHEQTYLSSVENNLYEVTDV